MIKIPVKFIYSSEDQRIYYVEFDNNSISENFKMLQDMMYSYPCDSFSTFNFFYEEREDKILINPLSYNKDILNNLEEDEFLEISELACQDIKETIYKIKDFLLKGKCKWCVLEIEVKDNSTIVHCDKDFGIDGEYIIKGLLNALWNRLFKEALNNPYMVLSVIIEDNNHSIIFYKGFIDMYYNLVLEFDDGIATDDTLDHIIGQLQKCIANFFSHELYIFTEWLKNGKLLYTTARRDKKKQLIN